MFKRIALALTFVAALGVAGLSMTNTAEAHRSCHRGGWYGGGYHSSYYGYAPRSSYYRGFSPRYYGGYPGVYRSHYGGYPGYYYGPSSGISFSFGF